MRKLNLANYTVKMKVPDKGNPLQKIDAELPYRMKDSVVNLLFSSDLKLNGAELMRQNMLAMKLESCEEDEILLEEAEWQRIVKAVEVFRNFGRHEVELVRRVNEAPEVDVTTK